MCDMHIYGLGSLGEVLHAFRITHFGPIQLVQKIELRSEAALSGSMPKKRMAPSHPSVHVAGEA